MTPLNEKIKQLSFRPVGVTEAVINALMEAILNGMLREGDQLVEAELQNHFKISKSAVRESLRELAQKGFVEIRPRRGAFVKAFTVKDIEENYRIRAVLEGLAAREALPRMTREQAELMMQEYDKIKVAAQYNNAEDFWSCHYRFHRIFLEASGNTALMDILRNLQMQGLWHRSWHKYYDQDLNRYLNIHGKIATHFLEKDLSPKEMESLVKQHIEDGLTNFLEHYNG